MSGGMGMLLPLLPLAFCFAGMGALSLAVERHHEQVHGRGHVQRRSHRLLLRLAGLVLLTWALALCISGWGAGVGIVAWCCWLSVGAVLVVLMLTYRARWTTQAVVLTGLLAVLSSGLA